MDATNLLQHPATCLSTLATDWLRLQTKKNSKPTETLRTEFLNEPYHVPNPKPSQELAKDQHEDHLGPSTSGEISTLTEEIPETGSLSHTYNLSSHHTHLDSY